MGHVLSGRPKSLEWKACTFDEDVFCLAMDGGDNNKNTVEEIASEVMIRVATACDVTMPQRGNRNPYKSVHWWNDEIASLRRNSNQARRLAQRDRRKAIHQALEADLD